MTNEEKQAELEIRVRYNGKIINVSELAPEENYFIKLQEFDFPVFPRFLGREIPKKIEEFLKQSPNIWTRDKLISGEILVEDGIFFYEIKRGKN